MSSNAHLFYFNIVLKELKWAKMLLRVPELVMMLIVQDVKKIMLSKTEVLCLWRFWQPDGRPEQKDKRHHLQPPAPAGRNSFWQRQQNFLSLQCERCQAAQDGSPVRTGNDNRLCERIPVPERRAGLFFNGRGLCEQYRGERGGFFWLCLYL